MNPANLMATARVALYARVSSDRQTREQTIDSQIAELERRIQQEGLTLDAELRFVDDGYSGSTLIRPALETLRDMAAAGAFQRLYVHSPDRLARAYAYQVLLVDELSRAGVELVFHNRPLSDTPEDALLLQVQGVVAEYERAKILERSRRGRLHAARQGKLTVMATAPYGYRYVHHRGEQEACYQIYLPEAQVIRQMFQWVATEGLSLSQVQARLGQQGIASPKGLPCWARPTIKQMLHNSAYQGQALYGKTRHGPCKPRQRPQKGQPEVRARAFSRYAVPPEQWFSIAVPALVEPELFQSVQEQLSHNRQRLRQRQASPVHLLRGLLVCRQCGYAFHLKQRGSHDPHRYYRCGGTLAQTFADRHCRCVTPMLQVEPTEAAVWEDVMRLLEDPGRLAQEYQRRLQLDAADTPDSLGHQLQNMILAQQRAISRLIDGFSEGLLQKHELEPRLQGARERLAGLQQQLHQQEDQQQQQRELRLVIGQLETFTQRIGQNLREADLATRRQVVCALIRQIEVDQDHLTVVYRVPETSPPTELNREEGSHCISRRPA